MTLDEKKLAALRHRVLEPTAIQVLGAENAKLRMALRVLLDDYDSIPEDAQIPDEINNTEHWEAVRAALAKAEG